VKGLENPTLVKERALFNVEGFEAEDDALDCDDEMECHGPVFRGSMFIAALDITAPVACIPPGNPPGSCNAPPPPAVGIAKIGWSANGSPAGNFHHGFADDDADGSIRAFATGAIAQHFTKSLDRVPGVDFRRATPDELDAMDALQRWLGRREEFDIGLMTFVDPIADDGRELYMTNGASCNTCHVNGGANFSTSIPNPDIHISQHTDVNSEAERLTEVTGVFIPEDEGIFADPPPPRPRWWGRGIRGLQQPVPDRGNGQRSVLPQQRLYHQKEWRGNRGRWWYRGRGDFLLPGNSGTSWRSRARICRFTGLVRYNRSFRWWRWRRFWPSHGYASRLFGIC